jgi:hypothetical protein
MFGAKSLNDIRGELRSHQSRRGKPTDEGAKLMQELESIRRFLEREVKGKRKPQHARRSRNR